MEMEIRAISISNGTGIMANVTMNAMKLNEILIKGRLPLIAVDAVLFLIGFLGNILVICVYQTKLGDQKGRFYIPYLAAADLVAITVTFTFMTLMDVTEALFPSDILCKIFQFLNWACVQISIFLLLVIVLHRYLLICHPLNVRMKIGERKTVVFGVVVLSFVIAIPVAIITGTSSVPMPVEDTVVDGVYCIFNYTHTDEKIYLWCLFVGNIIAMIITTALYIPIGRVVFLKSKGHRKNITGQKPAFDNIAGQTTVQAQNCNNVTQQTQNDNDLSNITQKYNIMKGTTQGKSTQSDTSAMNKPPTGSYVKYFVDSSNPVDNSVICSNVDIPDFETTSPDKRQMAKTVSDNHKMATKASYNRKTEATSPDTNTDAALAEARRHARDEAARRKFTLTFIAVVISYVISFTPFYVIVLNDLDNHGTWFDLKTPPVIINAFLFIHRCYMLNNVMNPIIYSLFDTAFRQELTKMLSKRLCCFND